VSAKAAVARRPGQGRVVTFYSYKGGTGRSMVLANIAWILAANGRRVLAVDWDLEAPGLHRYFHPFLLDPQLSATEGVIDFVSRFVGHAVSGAGRTGEELDPGLADLTEYAVRIDHEFPDGGQLDFVPAGRQGPGYAAKVNSFDWQTFYDRLGGGPFLQSMREVLLAEYDVVLIDSRTGVSDTAGVCTVDLPDDLVVCFTLNQQSIEGAAAVAQSVRAQRVAEPVNVHPVPMRVEFAEKLRLERARDAARERFDPFLRHLARRDRDRYWGEVEVVYQPFYAYEEVLAVFGDRPHLTGSVLSAVERLADWLTGGAVSGLPELPERERLELLARFERSGSVTPAVRDKSNLPTVFVSHTSRAAEVAERLIDALERGAPPYRLVTTERAAASGKDWTAAVEAEIERAAAIVALVTDDAERGLSLARQEWSLGQKLGKRIFPVLVGEGVRVPQLLADVRALRLSVDPPGDDFKVTADRLGTALASAVRHEAAPETPEEVTLDVHEERVHLVGELYDVDARHELQSVELQAIRHLAVHAAEAAPGLDQEWEDRARAVGEVLYRSLFVGRVRTVVEQLIATARESGQELSLRLKFSPNADELAVLPWETLFGPPGAAAEFLSRQPGVRMTLDLPRHGVTEIAVDDLVAFRREVDKISQIAEPEILRVRVERLRDDYRDRLAGHESAHLRMIELLRDNVGWQAVLEYVDHLPARVRNLPSVSEQTQLARARLGDVADSIAELERLIDRAGPTAQRLGILGGRFKQLMRQANDPRIRRGHLRDAIAAYERGMYLDLNEYYPSSNLPRLYRLRGEDGDELRAQVTAVVAVAACQAALARDADDVWAWLTRLGAAFDTGDVNQARRLYERIAEQRLPGWMLRTAADDLAESIALQPDKAVGAGLRDVLADVQALV
jgi:MinD-like ATPase involved in chromosome partitioning or flagellar assembly